MKKILDTRFKVNGNLFIIHHNDKRSEYEGKYKLMMYNEQVDSWMIKTTDDSLRFLKKFAEENAKFWQLEIRVSQKKWRKTIMVEMNEKMQKCFNEMNDEQKIRMFYELTKYMHENMEYGEDDDMNNLMDDIANVKNDIENL